jgi:hypothetical protein
VHVLYLWRSVLTTTGHLRKRIEKILTFHEFFTFFELVVKVNLKAYKPCTFLESASNLLLKKVPYLFVGQPKILTLLWNFSIFKAYARVEDFHILKSCRTKVDCDKHMQLLRPQDSWISQNTQITPPYYLAPGYFIAGSFRRGSFRRGSFRRGSFRRGSFRRGVISSRSHFVP